MRPIGYLAAAVGTALTLAFATIALTVGVDPYRFYGSPVLKGWTALKPRIDQQIRIAKTSQLERVAPRTLLLGNSRVEIGINPESPDWPRGAQPVFNAAEEGTGLPTALAMLRAAIAVRVPDTVLLGVDFLDFLQTPTPPETSAAPDPDVRPSSIRIWRDRLATTLTIGALYDSLATLLDQHSATSATMTPQGFNPLHEYRIYAARSGYHGLFAQKASLYETQYRRYPAPDFAEPFRYASFRRLRQIIELAARHKIRLILYIHPYHSDYLEMLRRVGLWPSFESWKRALVRVVDAENRILSAKVPLYDFAEYDRLTTEPVPPPGDRHSKMRWYWESAHYKSALGDQVLAVIFGGSKGFGELLTPLDIDRRLAGIRKARHRFLTGGRQGLADASSLSEREAPR